MGKITEEEIGKINAIKQEASQLVYLLGELQYQKMAIELNEEDIKNRIKEIRKSESELLSEFRSKYGNVNINIENGEIS